jgi:hypothetical protein
MKALVPTTWMPMKVKQLTTNELIEDNTIDAEIACEWEGHDIKIVIDPAPILASKHFLSNLRVGDNIEVKGKLLITVHRKQKEGALKSSLILKEAEIMAPSKYKKFQTDPAVDLTMDPVYFFQCLADPTQSYRSTPLPPLVPGRPLKIPPLGVRRPRLNPPQKTAHQVLVPEALSTIATPTSAGFPSSAGAQQNMPDLWQSGCFFMFDGRGRQIVPGGRLLKPWAGNEIFKFMQYFEDGRRRAIVIRNIIQQREGLDTLAIEETWLQGSNIGIAPEGNVSVNLL